jgi:ABC-2 type transport system permease protein
MSIQTDARPDPSLGTDARRGPATTGSRGIGFWPAVRIVAERELFVKLRDRTFLISTVVTLLFVVVAFTLPSLLAGGADEYRVATAGPAAEEVVASLESAAEAPGEDGAEIGADITVEAVTAADPEAADQLVRDGEADVALVDTGPGATAPVEIVGDTDVPGDLVALVDATLTDRAMAQALEDLGADAATVTAALTPVEAPERLLDPDGAQSTEALLLEFAFAAVFFFTALTFGLTIAQSVTEEKQQRVVELLVAAVPVRAVLVGKIAGNVVLAIGQIVLLLAVGLLAAAIVGEGQFVPLLANSAGWFVVFFVFGFVMLSCLWAAAGSLASRYEDLGATTLPIQLFVTLPFLLAVSVREGPVRVAMSYIPFSSPIVMPQRLVAGEAQWWEAVASLVIIAATAVVLVLAAERLYRGSVLRTRGRVSLKEAWAGGAD